MLEVGPGPGELSRRIADELGATVVAVDTSERMVELARSRGVDARVGDVQSLPFPGGSFDTVVAAWMLYHVPDLRSGLGEIHRVLRPGGRLVAVTNSERHLDEVRRHAGVDIRGRLPFNRGNGAALLADLFGDVQRTDVDGWVTFPDSESIRRSIGSMVTESSKAERVPDGLAPVRAGIRVTVFVATRR